LNSKHTRFAVVVVLVANFIGCSFAASGAAIFCTATRAPIEWFTIPFSLLLIVTTPLLIVGLFRPQVSVFAVVIGIITLAGLGVQHYLLERDILYCDAP
jgi:hypothetical protein